MSEYSTDDAVDLLEKIKLVFEHQSSLMNLSLQGKRLYKPKDKKIVAAVCDILIEELTPYISDTLTPKINPMQSSIFMSAYTELMALKRAITLRGLLSKEALTDSGKLVFDRDKNAVIYNNYIKILRVQETETNKLPPIDLDI